MSTNTIRVLDSRTYEGTPDLPAGTKQELVGGVPIIRLPSALKHGEDKPKEEEKPVKP